MSVTSCINIFIRNKVSLPKSITDGSIFGLGPICLVVRVFMCDCSVFLSGTNVVYVIERMQKTFICNYLPLKLNFLARLLWNWCSVSCCFRITVFNRWYSSARFFVSSAAKLLSWFRRHARRLIQTKNICQQPANNFCN